MCKFSMFDLISFGYISGQRIISGFIGTKIFLFKRLIFGVKVGRESRSYGSIIIMRYPRSEIIIGNNFSNVSSSARCTAGSIYSVTKLRTHSKTAKIILGDNVGLNGTSIVARSKTVSIGDNTIIAPNCVIMDSDFHALWPPDNRVDNPDLEKDADVIIGRNVWIGSKCIILKGSSIGDNSVIGAGSVVNREIPSNVLAAGVPARVIRNLP